MAGAATGTAVPQVMGQFAPTAITNQSMVTPQATAPQYANLQAAPAPQAPANLAATLAAPENMDVFAAQGVYGAGSGAAQEMGYQPLMIGPVGSVQAGQLATTDLAPYMNPYEQQVIQGTLSDIGRSALQAQNELARQAGAAGAFGGSRHGVAMGELGRGVAEETAQTVAQLRQQGYTQAQASAMADIQNRLQAEQADRAAQLQASLANQTAGLAGSTQRLSAASTLGNLANLGFGMGATTKENLRLQAELKRAQEQARIDAARAQAAEAAAQPYKALSTLSAALGGTPMGQTGTTSKQPGLMDYLTLGASMFASDIRLKTDIKRVGTFENGLPMYEWKWNAKAKEIGVENHPTIGVIAQEARKKFPNAVFEGSDGYLRVNYKEII